jgi:ComF family protein
MQVDWSTIVAALHRWQRGLLPPSCLLCAGAGGTGGMDLCDPCRDAFPAAVPIALAPFARVVCPWRYAYPVDRAIQALKFRGERAWARVFGTLLAQACCRRGGGGPGAEPLPGLIVPVPLHPRRLRERGYNQSADLARIAARALRLPLDARALERCRDTAPQSALPAAARAANVAAAFRATRQLPGLRVALVDDVLTTGSTAGAAAAALLAAGAGSVELWVVAHAARGGGQAPSAARRIPG